MTLKGTLTIIFLVLFPAICGAEQSGRYILQRAGDGFIRLDTTTGNTAHCSLKQAAWQCDSLDDGAALQQEMRRLSAENKRLKARIETLEKGATGNNSHAELPTDEEFGRIMDFVDMAMRRFMEFARELKNDPGKGI